MPTKHTIQHSGDGSYLYSTYRIGESETVPMEITRVQITRQQYETIRELWGGVERTTGDDDQTMPIPPYRTPYVAELRGGTAEGGSLPDAEVPVYTQHFVNNTRRMTWEDVASGYFHPVNNREFLGVPENVIRTKHLNCPYCRFVITIRYQNTELPKITTHHCPDCHKMIQVVANSGMDMQMNKIRDNE